MADENKIVGAYKAMEQLLGKGDTDTWAGKTVRWIVRKWGFFFVILVFMTLWFPNIGPVNRSVTGIWLLIYVAYLGILEILAKKATSHYDRTPLRLIRIQFNIIMIAWLGYIALPLTPYFVWFFFTMPIVSAVGYFGVSAYLLVVYLEIAVALFGLGFAQGWDARTILVTSGTETIILGILAAVLIYFVHLFPRRRQESTLLAAATTLINVLNPDEISQLLADAAKAGIPEADAAVVHLIGGEDNRTLIPKGSSSIDLTTLGRTLMSIGKGIAGHALQARETINIPDVTKDERFVRLPSSFTHFSSLLVAPMYVGEKRIGTISVHSAEKEAFDERQERFITMLAAQGATALANAELYDIRRRRRQQISDILEASLSFGLNQPLDALLKRISQAVCRCSGYQMAVVNLVDEEHQAIMVKAMAGVPEEGKQKLEGLCIPLEVIDPLFQEEFRISRSYYIRHDRCPDAPTLDQYTFTPDLGNRRPGEWHPKDILLIPIQTREQELVGYISVDDPVDLGLPSLDTVQAIEVLASVAATAIQNARLFEAEYQRRKELELLHQGNLELTSLDLQSTLDAILGTALKLVSADDAHLFLYDGVQLSFGAARWAGDSQQEPFTDPRPQGLTYRVARSGERFIVNDINQHPLYQDMQWEGAIVGLPLSTGNRVNGVMNVFYNDPHRFDEHELRALELLADQAAIAIENAHLYGESQQRMTQLALLNDISRRIARDLELESVLERTARLVQKSFGYYDVTLYTLDQESEYLVMQVRAGAFADLFEDHKIKLGHGMVGWVGQHGETLLSNDVSQEPKYINFFPHIIHTRSELTVPIRMGEEVLGVLDIQSPYPNTFCEDDVRVMETLADQIAVAMKNARLYEEATRHAEELATLNDASQAITSTLNPDQVLISFLEKIKCLLDVTAASVWLVEPETGNLICEQATEPGSQIMHKWRLKSGEGLVGCAAEQAESIIVPDTREDTRHFKELDRELGIEVRSILSVPLKVKQKVVGVLELVDTRKNRFKLSDLNFVEPFAASAAVAIENARLFETTQRLRTFNQSIVDSMQEGILLEDENGHISFVNPRTVELLKYDDSNDLVGQHWTEIVDPEVRERTKKMSAKRPMGIGESYESVLLTKNGERVPVIVNAKSIDEQGKRSVLAVFTDIRARKQQEMRLREYLTTVTNRLAHRTNLEELIEFIADVGQSFLAAGGCCLFLTNDEGELELVTISDSQYNRDLSPCKSPDSGKVRCAIAEYVVDTCESLRLSGDDIARYFEKSDLCGETKDPISPSKPLSSLLAVPICLPDGETIGALAVWDSESPQGFSDFDEELIETLASYAAAGIEGVKRLKRIREDAIRAERKRLESDLHEAMNVLATGVRWEADLIAESIEHRDLKAAISALDRLQAARARAYADLRYLLEDLRDPTLEQEGLVEALRKRSVVIGGDQIVVQDAEAELGPLPPKIGALLYRVGQEAMSNAVKHAGTSRDEVISVKVRLEKENSKIRLYVEDNGVGFDVEETLDMESKWGLRRLIDMMREIGGNLEIDSNPGEGTTVCATVYMNGEEREWS